MSWWWSIGPSSTRSFASWTAHFPDRPADAVPLSVDQVHPSLLKTWDDLTADKPPPPPTADQIAKSNREFAAFENSPWGSTPWGSGDTMNLPFSWSRAEATIPVVVAMAREHGLTIYDSQSGRVTNPIRQPTQSAAEFLSVHLTLRLAGQPPAVDVMLAQDGRIALHTTTTPDRVSAHAAARQFAIEQHDRAYEVDDPRSLAQGSRFTPLQPGDSGLPPAAVERLRQKGITLGTIVGPNGPAAPSSPPSVRKGQ